MIDFLRRFWGICAVLLCCHSFSCFAQSEVPLGLEAIDSLLDIDAIEKANFLLEKELDTFLANDQLDSLYKFPIYVGKIAAKRGNSKMGATAAEKFISDLKSRTSNPRTLFKAYLSLDELYVQLGDDESSVIASKTALDYAQKTPDISQEELGSINYTIGGNYYALFDLSNAISYFKASATAYERAANAKMDKLADAYNGVAVSMWTLNKLDSAEIYFHKAIETTKKSDLTDYDMDYYIVAFQFNLALVIDAQGNIGEAIELKEEIIGKLQRIIQGSEDDFLVKKSKRLQASAISNLAAFYHDTGYLTKAYEMLQYAYSKKKEVFGVDSPRLAISAYQKATSEIELLEYDKSISTAQAALTDLKKAPSRYLSVEADLIYSMAKAYSKKNEIAQAKELYEQSEALYNEAYPSEYSREYLILLRDYALFLAENNDTEKAISIARKSYDYIAKNSGDNNIPIIKETTNLSEVYFQAGDYDNAFKWAEEAQRQLDLKLSNTTSVADSIQVEYFRPIITQLEVQSLMKLSNRSDKLFFKDQIKKIARAVAVLERRKTTTFNNDDINNLLAEYSGLNSISKSLYHKLYSATQNSYYLDQTMAIHESGIYNRIRTQFNIRNNIRFGGIPEAVIERENQLKKSISDAIKNTETSDISTYFKANNAWSQFLDTLKTDFPKYYDLRYATIEQPITDLQKNIPAETTVVRYFFIEKQLYGLVITANSKSLTDLNPDGLEDQIGMLAENQGDIKTVGPLYHQLYQQLWQPMESSITTDNIIIIPDGVLFNLSFETLTPLPISSFEEFATNSLLARHNLSYNYSLLLMDEDRKTVDYSNNFVAFAPEFSDKMKAEYQIAVTDSLELDKTYLTLLPQPFSLDIAQEYSRRFKGSSFLNEKSTKQLFTANASEHKIIHIATHAESNNISPELSRLVFAKNVEDEESIRDNYLYTYEIYNQNLSSNLAILTACETGKPTHQPGEGMISLAHAFNYAGSESILTSLWKIDEQSSTRIIGHFYENLKLGMPKDEALRQAKLTYITNAQGRTAAPQYWAGLVLMGDASPVDLSSGTPFWVWLLGALVLLVVAFLIFRKRA